MAKSTAALLARIDHLAHLERPRASTWVRVTELHAGDRIRYCGHFYRIGAVGRDESRVVLTVPKRKGRVLILDYFPFETVEVART